MQANEFIQVIRQEVIEDDISMYGDLLGTTINATDPVWKGMLPIYQSLSVEQKVSVLAFIRLVEVNAISGILGIVDGSTALTGGPVEFKLFAGQAQEPINGDLQEIFLEMEELRRISKQKET